MLLLLIRSQPLCVSFFSPLISLSASTVFILCFSAIFPYCSWCCIWCVVGKLELSSSEEYWFSFKQMANLAGLTLLWLLRLPLSILQQFLASWPHISYSRVSEGCGQSQSGDFVGSVFGGSFTPGSPCPPHTSRYCSTILHPLIPQVSRAAGSFLSCSHSIVKELGVTLMESQGKMNFTQHSFLLPDINFNLFPWYYFL